MLQLIYSLTIFVGAFLLFQIQPMIGKALLPWFGGTPAVWTSCMLFFQIVLLLGYAYAHFIFRYFPLRKVTLAHSFLLIVAVLSLPVVPDSSLKPTGSESPLISIVLILFQTVFLPYLVLACSSPFFQRWYSLVHTGTPYRLFALSNSASFLALMSYPFFIERFVVLPMQDTLWSITFLAYALLAIITMFITEREAKRQSISLVLELPTEAWLKSVHWITLSACGVILMLAVTNELCQDIAVVPFLWIAPLALYLLTFVICFEYLKLYRRKAYLYLYLFLTVALFIVWDPSYQGPLLLTILVFLAVLFLGCMLCHGELSRSKPKSQHLTFYYLCLSLGGAIGGVYVGIISPLLFHDFFEFPLVLAYCPLMVLSKMLANDVKFERTFREIPYKFPLLASLTLTYFLLSSAALNRWNTDVAIHRDFFGVLRVRSETTESGDKVQTLVFGDTIHGAQFTDPSLASKPLMYFGPESGAGYVLQKFKEGEKRSIAIIGLGIGSMLTYTSEQDSVDILELSPAVVSFASEYFTYLDRSKAAVSIHLGDGRLLLEQEKRKLFDIILLDAFSGDNVPAHLLTEEAIALYLQKLSPNGVLVFQISNRYLNLAPVLRGVANYHDLQWVEHDDGGGNDYTAPSRYMIMSKSSETLLKIFGRVDTDGAKHSILWTDSYSSLFSLMR